MSSIAIKRFRTKFRYLIYNPCIAIFICTLSTIIGLFYFYIYMTTLFKNSSQSLQLYSHSEQSEIKSFGEISKQYAITACSIHSSNDAYCFYTPFITLAWRRLGYEVIIIFVGDFQKSNQTKSVDIQLIMKHIHQFGGKTYEFQCPEIYSRKISQIIRIFIGFLPLNFVNDNDYLITTDADLIPLNYKQYVREKDYSDGFIVNRYCCDFFSRRNRTYRMIPMGHVYMKRYLWREIILQSIIHKELIDINQNFHHFPRYSHEYNLTKHYTKSNFNSLLLNKDKIVTFDIISLYLRHEFSEMYDEVREPDKDGWDMDQILLTMLLIDYQNMTTDGQKLKIHERKLLNRLDREQKFEIWAAVTDFSIYGDAHLTHFIFRRNFWPTHLHFFTLVFGKTYQQIFNEYYQTFLLQRMNWI